MNHKQILIVEDDELICEFLNELLQDAFANIELTITMNAEVALDQFRHQKFDLVITDYRLPGMNGVKLAEQVHTIAPKARLILMSGTPLSVIYKENGQADNISGYISKPFSVLAITRMISQILDRSPDYKSIVIRG